MQRLTRNLLLGSKHPLFLLIAGTLIGSIVVPRVNSRMDHERQLHDLRCAKGSAVLQAGLETERRLNLVETEFESFYKDELVPGKASEKSRQALQERVHKTYQEFDHDAWWWHTQTVEEVKMLRLVDAAKLPELEQAVKNYQQTLIQSTTAFDPYWAELIRSNTMVSSSQAAATLNKVHPELQALAERRMKMIQKIVQTIID